MKERIEKLLDLMVFITDDDATRWEEKKKLVEQALSKSEAYQTAWEEFQSWWFPDDEDDPA